MTHLLSRLARRLPGYDQIAPLIDTSQLRQTDSAELAGKICVQNPNFVDVLDLGCGDGASLELFEGFGSAVRWRGVDIEASPEVAARTISDARIDSFDGVNLPYPDDSFDLIYCHQVLEHVRYPHELLKEVSRVLRPGGIFLGSVSYLEPYHSFSTFNFTPFGLIWICSDSGLGVNSVCYSSSFGYKILRQMMGGGAFVSRMNRFSVLYGLISFLGALTRSPRRDVNLLKLQYSGVFCFTAKKAG